MGMENKLNINISKEIIKMWLGYLYEKKLNYHSWTKHFMSKQFHGKWFQLFLDRTILYETKCYSKCYS
jgi:hypothetical protein